MSRKKTQPKKNVVLDPKFNSTIIPKLINNIMYDGKRGVANRKKRRSLYGTKKGK